MAKHWTDAILDQANKLGELNGLAESMRTVENKLSGTDYTTVRDAREYLCMERHKVMIRLGVVLARNGIFPIDWLIDSARNLAARHARPIAAD